MKNFKTYLIITIFFSILALVAFNALEKFAEPWITNQYTRLFTTKVANDNVVMVMLDQKSVGIIRWPWKRKLFAELLEYLEDYGQAKVVVHDALIFSPDNDFPKSDEYFFNTLKKYDNYISGFDGGRNLQGYQLMTKEDIEILNGKTPLNITYKGRKPSYVYNDIIKLHPLQLRNASMVASVITPTDNKRDGFIRTALPIININGKEYPMLAFAAVMKYTGINSFYIKDNYLCSADDDCKTIKLKGYNTPRGFEMGIKWYKQLDAFSTHKTYSAIDILDSYTAIKQGKKPIINPAEFKDKIVIIGGNAAKVKSLEDIKSTPLITNTHAGADIQATVINNILSNDSRVEITYEQKFIVALTLVLLSILIISAFKLTEALIASSILMGGYFIAATIMFIKGTTLQIITPIFLMILVVSAGFTFRFLLEGKKKEQIQNAMGMYISKDIMKNVVKNIDNLKLGGKRANITVLFADIRGFTSISERLTAEEVTAILNEYFSAVEPVIRKHNGVLNKFIGDAVLAIFGEPIQDKNHAKNAVLCAAEMHEKMERLQRKWDLEGKPHIEIGIAINTGEAFVGNIGSPERIEYTVIGDTVNTASRIEAYNKVYKTRFLISESTYEKISRICDVIKIREVSIRGKSKKINIYEVLRVIPDNNDNIKRNT